MLQSIFHFQSEQHEDLEEISKLDNKVEKLARLYDSQIQQHVRTDVSRIRAQVEALSDPIRRLVDISTIYSKSTQEQQSDRFLGWLSSTPYSQHHDRHSEQRLPGSAEWLFKHPQYIDWNMSSDSALLLLHGIPGSGKTKLVSSVVDRFIQDKLKDSLAAPLAYFYCGDSSIGRTGADADEVMRSLTRQFAVVNREKRQVHEQILLEYERRDAEAKLDGFDAPRLRSSECADLILRLLEHNPAIIIVDAVDEVEDGLRHELLSSLVRIREESASVVKILVSSRNSSQTFAQLPHALKLHIEESETRKDMEAYICHRISVAVTSNRLLGGNFPRAVQDELVDFLIKGAGEM